MKKLKVLFCFSLFIFSFSFCFGQSWLWGRQGKLLGMKEGATAIVATDAYGNAFLTGYYFPKVIFGSDTLIDSAPGYQAYYVKYNSLGIVQWAKQFTSTDECYSTSIATDVSNNVIIAGQYEDDITIGSYNLTGNFNVFLTKLNNNGNPLWAISIGGADDVYTNTNALATDKSKNIFISGYFSGTMTLGAINLVGPNSSYNIFTAKCDSNGNVIWANQGITISPVANYYSQSNSIATDPFGNSFVTGIYEDSIVFGSDTLTSPIVNNNQSGNAFLVKYSPAGNVMWARQSILPSAASNCFAYSVTTDDAGNVYLTGSFTDTVSFGAFTLTGDGLFFVKYNANGNVIWAQSAGANAGAAYIGSSLTSDKYNNIYLSGEGYTDSNITFGSYTIYAPRNSYFNSFIAKFDTAGNALCGSMLYNGGAEGGFGNHPLAVDKSGDYVYHAGTFFNDTIFCGIDTLIVNDNITPYVVRWQSCLKQEQGINELKTNNEKLTVYPNPFTNTTTIVLNSQYSLPNTHYLELDDLTGRKLRWIEFTGIQYQLQANDLAKGLYFIRAYDSDMNVIGTSKIVVQ